jgi:MFS superfamily sulfate permease-like transporter
MTTKTRDNIVAGGIALGSVFFLVWAIPNFTPAYPGYGVSSRLLPNVVISLILALSVLSLVTNILFHYRTKSSVTTEERRAEKEKDEIRPEDKVHLWHLAIFMIPCILLFPALRWIGFIPGAILFMMVMQYFCGQRNPLIIVIVAICTAGVIYMAIMYGLKVPMP